MKRIHIRSLSLVLFATAGLAFLLFIFWPALPIKDSMTRIDTEMQSIATALDVYIFVFGSPPSGTPEDIMIALHGHNAQDIVFLEKNRPTDPPMRDPWNTPYSITTADDRIIVASAGPDAAWNSRDDYMIHKTIEHAPPEGRVEAPRP